MTINGLHFLALVLIVAGLIVWRILTLPPYDDETLNERHRERGEGR